VGSCGHKDKVWEHVIDMCPESGATLWCSGHGDQVWRRRTVEHGSDGEEFKDQNGAIMVGSIPCRLPRGGAQ
jgi:hypothetical protein